MMWMLPLYPHVNKKSDYDYDIYDESLSRLMRERESEREREREASGQFILFNQTDVSLYFSMKSMWPVHISNASLWPFL